MGLGVSITPPSGSPDAELDKASSVEVHERLGEPVTFRLRYAIDVTDGDFPLLEHAALDPGSELMILAPVGGTTQCLVRGIVHAQRVHFAHGGAGSSLEVQGSDRLIELDRESKSVIWKGTASDAVSKILGDAGFAPDVENTSTAYDEKTHLLVQRDSDYRFARREARRRGFHLWVTSDDRGTETAHWKRLPLDGEVAAELTINVSPPSLSTLDLAWDVERPTSVETTQLDLGALTDIDGSAKTPLVSLGSESLASIAPDVRSVFLAAPADDAGDLASRAEGTLVEADFFVRATCNTSVAQLGKVVRAHTVVAVRGLGARHSGKYLVSAVRHSIDATAHRMELELLRNGWGA